MKRKVLIIRVVRNTYNTVYTESLLGNTFEVIEDDWNNYYTIISGPCRGEILIKIDCEIFNLDKIIKNI